MSRRVEMQYMHTFLRMYFYRNVPHQKAVGGFALNRADEPARYALTLYTS